MTRAKQKIMEEVKFQSAEVQPQATDQLRTAPKQAKLAKIIPYLVVVLLVGLGILTGLVASSVLPRRSGTKQRERLRKMMILINMPKGLTNY